MTALRIPIEGEFEVTRPRGGVARVRWPKNPWAVFEDFDHVPDWMTRDYPILAAAVRWVIDEANGSFRGEPVKYDDVSQSGCWVRRLGGDSQWVYFADHPNEPDLQARRPKEKERELQAADPLDVAAVIESLDVLKKFERAGSDACDIPRVKSWLNANLPPDFAIDEEGWPVKMQPDQVRDKQGRTCRMWFEEGEMFIEHHGEDSPHWFSQKHKTFDDAHHLSDPTQHARALAYYEANRPLADDEARVDGKVVKLGKWQTRGWDGEVIEWHSTAFGRSFCLGVVGRATSWTPRLEVADHHPCNVPGQHARLRAMWDEATGGEVVSCCEKCWSDAMGSAERYRRLTESRRECPCTPEEHAGKFAEECPDCGRRTVHQATGICIICSGEREP